MALYFGCIEVIQQAGDYILFKSEQKHPQKFVGQLKSSANPHEIRVSAADYPLPNVKEYIVLNKQTFLFVQGGQSSFSV